MPQFTIDKDFRNYWTPQTKEEQAALRLKIETEGPRPGSIVLARVGHALYLMDGHHTHDICRDLDIPLPPPVIYPLPNRESVIAWIDQNQRARRNAPKDVLDARRQERIDRERQARVEGKSIRAIAEQENISPTTVANDVAGVTVQGCTVTGQDGRRQPAARPKRPPSANGEPVFDKRLVTEYLGKTLRELDKLAREYGLLDGRGRVQESPEHLALRRLLDEFDAGLEKWRKSLKRQKQE